MRGRVLLEGAGAGILCTLSLTWNQLSPYHTDLYHRLLPITSVVRTITVFLVVACIGCAALLALLERLDRERRTLLWAVFFAILALRGVGEAEIICMHSLPALPVFFAVLAIAILLWFFRRQWYVRLAGGLCGALLLLGFCIFWMLPQLIYLGVVRQPQEMESFHKPVPHIPDAHRRVVWLLFDELSYDQTFDHRYPGLMLPNFDHLRGQSVVFSDMRPQGYFTEDIVPALFTGRDIEAIRSSVTGQLFIRLHGSHPWLAFDSNQSVFADAERRGWTTGIVGTYNPYCRILARQLDSCQSSLEYFDHHLSSARSMRGNLEVFFEGHLARLEHLPFEVPPSAAQSFNSFVASAQALIQDEDIDFVFIHLPLPHPRGFYNRRTKRIAPGGSYLDNLALADDTLGKLLNTLNQTRSAGMTTLVVSSDHSWRVPMWRHSGGWTQEDELASQGRFDSRPTLVVHFPGETQPEEVGQVLPLLAMHDLLQGMVQDRIDSPADLNLNLEKMRSLGGN